MPGIDPTSEITHLRQALHNAENQEVRYHIREALQHLYATEGGTQYGRV